MSLLQPELAKIQAKYPNSKTNQFEKQRLAQEQMELYKRNGVSPFSQFAVLFLQFPIFIAVWGAMTGSAVLATGSFLGLNLNSSIGNAIMNNLWSAGWWTALILFILMGVGQFVAMKLPTWLQKKDLKKVGRTMKNPAAESQQKQMQLMSNVMLIMIVVMGFSLPSAMGIYWFIGALISVSQTLITRKVMARKK
jgi:YidC/Oxa1 family membrane protein insertase